MDTQNTNRQLRYLEEVRNPLHRAGFETLPLEGEQLPVLWNGAPLCRITGKGSVFYRREDADTPQAEDALYRVEDIAAKTLEYMTAMETGPQLKASGLDGDYRILADFGGTVLAGTPSKHAVAIAILVEQASISAEQGCQGKRQFFRARFYRGVRFRISLILSHRNLVGECLPQTLLYAA